MINSSLFIYKNVGGVSKILLETVQMVQNRDFISVNTFQLSAATNIIRVLFTRSQFSTLLILFG